MHRRARSATVNASGWPKWKSREIALWIRSQAMSIPRLTRRLIVDLVSLSLLIALSAFTGRGTSAPSPAKVGSVSAVLPEPFRERSFRAQSGAYPPLVFEPNYGQASPEVRFLARAPGYTLFLTQTGAVMLLRGGPAGPSSPSLLDLLSNLAGTLGIATSNAVSERLNKRYGGGANTTAIQMILAGSRKPLSIKGLDPTGGTSNYFIGNDPTHWRTHIPHYRQVEYTSVYPGIDLVYYDIQGTWSST